MPATGADGALRSIPAPYKQVKAVAPPPAAKLQCISLTRTASCTFPYKQVKAAAPSPAAKLLVMSADGGADAAAAAAALAAAGYTAAAVMEGGFAGWSQVRGGACVPGLSHCCCRRRGGGFFSP